MPDSQEPIGRVRFMDAQRVNLDGFATENAALGMIAYDSPSDPAASLVVRDGCVVEMDGKAEDDFDSIDEFIARHGLDLEVADEAMAATTSPTPGCWWTPPSRAPSWSGSPSGMTPAKLAAPLGAAASGRADDGHDQGAGATYAEQPGARHQSAGRPVAQPLKFGDRPRRSASVSSRQPCRS